MSRSGNCVPAGHRAKPVFREDIATAMEMRTAGSSEETIYKFTGVTSMDFTVAEIMGFDAYPSRHDSITTGEPAP